jgi:hypothetical protein
VADDGGGALVRNRAVAVVLAVLAVLLGGCAVTVAGRPVAAGPVAAPASTDPCQQFVTADEVSRAMGVPVVRVSPSSYASCAFLLGDRLGPEVEVRVAPIEPLTPDQVWADAIAFEEPGAESIDGLGDRARYAATVGGGAQVVALTGPVGVLVALGAPLEEHLAVTGDLRTKVLSTARLVVGRVDPGARY